jgi:hypothetical protein
LDTLEVEKHEIGLLLFDVILDLYVIVKKVVLLSYFRRLSCFHRLKKALVTFGADILLARGTSHHAAVMIICADPSNDAIARLTFYQGTT